MGDIDGLPQELSALLQSHLLAGAKKVSFPAGQTVFRQGDQCTQYFIVLTGSVKVFARGDSGREIVLYRVSAGHTCVLTTSCLMGHSAYPAEGVTETQLEALLIPVEKFQQGMLEESFRNFVFDSYGQRITELIKLIEQLTFTALDRRLADYLLDHCDSEASVLITHQQLATELGTAREVVSRHLKEFEKNGWLKMQRGLIKIVDRTAMSECARQMLNKSG
jgi:CRP/FNR family transcriptional regulator